MRAFVLIGLLMLLPSASFGADPKNSTRQSTGSSGEIKLQKKTGPGGVLTLREVIAQVLLYNPEMEAFSLEIRAREARALQAGLYSIALSFLLRGDALSGRIDTMDHSVQLMLRNGDLLSQYVIGIDLPALLFLLLGHLPNSARSCRS